MTTKHITPKYLFSYYCSFLDENDAQLASLGRPIWVEFLKGNTADIEVQGRHYRLVDSITAVAGHMSGGQLSTNTYIQDLENGGN